MSRQIIRKLVRSLDSGEQMESMASRRITSAATSRAYAPASPAPQRDSRATKSPLTFSIAEKVNVMEVPVGTNSEWRPSSDTDTMVLDGHAFGVAEAVEWVRRANEHARKQHLRAPLITIIADENRLTEYEYRLVTKRLADLGGVFFEYPERVSTFEEAFIAYAKGVAQTYKQCSNHRRRA